jgi:hypothetical protein
VTKTTPKKSPYFAKKQALKQVDYVDSDFAQSVQTSKFSPKDSRKALMKRNRKASVVKYQATVSEKDLSDNEKCKSNVLPLIDNDESKSVSKKKKIQKTSSDKNELQKQIVRLNESRAGFQAPAYKIKGQNDGLAERGNEKKYVSSGTSDEVYNDETVYNTKEPKKLDLRSVGEGYGVKQKQIVRLNESRAGFQSPAYKIKGQNDGLAERGNEKKYVSSGTSDEVYNDETVYNTKEPKKLDLRSVGEGYGMKQKQIVRLNESRAGFQSPSYGIYSHDGSLSKRGREKNYVSVSSDEIYNDKPAYSTKMEQTSAKRNWTQVDMDASSDDSGDHSRKLPNLIDTVKSQKKPKLSDTTRHQTAIKPLELVPQEDFFSNAISRHIKVNHKSNLKMLSYFNKQFLNRLSRLQANQAQELNEFTVKLKTFVKSRYLVQESV